MSEQFGIDRSFGNGAAVHGDIFIVFTCRIGMDHLRENSLPTPLSPVTSTERSVGATRRATSSARLSASELPMIPKRFLWMSDLSFLLYQSCFTANTGKLFLSRIRNGLHTPVRSGSHGLRHGRCELFEVFALQTLDLRPA